MFTYNATGAITRMTLATVDEVIELWLQFSGERWDSERRERARTHPWPRYLTQFTADELNEGGIRLLASTQPFTWGFWYRRTRRLAVTRLGPIPPGARITPSATLPPTPPSSASTSPGRSAGQTALQRAQAALRAGDAKTALDIARRTLTDNGALPASMTAREAADIVLAAFLGNIRDLRGLTEAASDAERYLHSLAPPDSTKRGALQEHLDQIAAAKVHLERGSSSSLTRLCALLRQPPFRRPDLGVLAADAALTQRPKNTAALTTKAAALMDLDRLHHAQTTLDTAWELDGTSSHVAVAMCRLHLKSRWTTEALRWGERATELDPTSIHARRMHLAALLAAGELIGRIDLDALDDDRTPTVSRFDAVQAAQQLGQEGDIEQAREALHKILAISPGYDPAVRALRQLD